MLTKFFYDLTKRNWGWPYHVWIATWLTVLIYGLYLFIFALRGEIFLPMWYNILTWFTINFIGIGYEIYQARIKNERKGFWEDIIGNNLGYLTGIFIIYYLRLFNVP